MLVSALFTIFGLGVLCWLLFTLAVYALPFWIGLSAALWLHAAEQGLLVAILGGIAVAGGVAALGEIAFARVRSVPLRLPGSTIERLLQGDAETALPQPHSLQSALHVGGAPTPKEPQARTAYGGKVRISDIPLSISLQ